MRSSRRFVAESFVAELRHLLTEQSKPSNAEQTGMWRVQRLRRIISDVISGTSYVVRSTGVLSTSPASAAAAAAAPADRRQAVRPRASSLPERSTA